MPAKIAALVGPKLAGDRFLVGAMILRFQKYLYFLAVRCPDSEMNTSSRN
jgi:hypothetical protein